MSASSNLAILLLIETVGVGAFGEFAIHDHTLLLILAIFEAVAIKLAFPQSARLLSTILLLGLGCIRRLITVSAIHPSVVVTDNFISYTESTKEVLSGIRKLGCGAVLELTVAKVFTDPVLRIDQLYCGIPLATDTLLTPIVKSFEEHIVPPPTSENIGFGAGCTRIDF